MSYKPGDAYYGEFVTSSTTGAAVNADSLPSATVNKNGTDDGTFTLTVVNLDTGRYKITGTIPVGYVKGDVVNVHVSATIGGVVAKCVVDGFIIDSKRVGDLNDAAALTDYQQRGVAVTLPANPPAGFIVAASIGTAALNGKGDWNTVAPDNASITAIKAVTDKIGFTGTGPWTVNANASISGNVTVGGYAAGQDPATLVWSATATAFNVGGSMGSKLNAAGSSADPLANAVPGTYVVGSGGYALGKLLTGNVTVTTPVSVGGDTTIIRGDDYTGTRAIAYRDNASLWPDNPTTVDWYVTRPDAPNTVVLHKVVTVSPTSGNPKTGTVALSNVDTAGLYDSTYHLYMVWTAGGVTYTLIQGTLTVNTR